MIPKRLKKGDTIGIVAPSNNKKIKNEKYINKGIELLKNWGFKVELGKSFEAVDKYGVSAGSAELRADDINRMFANPDIKLIWCAWGGDTANETLDLLDYPLIRSNPKIFMGLSDNTVLTNAVNEKTGLITFHSTDITAKNKDECFGSIYTQKEFKRILIDGKIGEIPAVSDRKLIRDGSAKGKLIGGNLSGTLKLAGTKYFPDYSDAILLIEGCHTTIKDAVYQLTQLKHIGVFERIKGIVIGYMYTFDNKKQFDKEGRRVYFEDIVLDITGDYSFPILKVYEFGHYCPSTFLPIGGIAEIDAGKKSFKIVEKCVE